MLDYYEILQVSPKADQEVIQAAFRRLALKCHPDRGADPSSSERMKLLNQAYAVLSDPSLRRQYDQERQENRRHGSGQQQDKHHGHSLEPCRSCGQLVAPSALACPHCGEQLPVFKVYLRAAVDRRWRGRFWSRIGSILGLSFLILFASGVLLHWFFSPAIGQILFVGFLFFVPLLVWGFIHNQEEQELMKFMESQRKMRAQSAMIDRGDPVSIAEANVWQLRDMLLQDMNNRHYRD